MHIEDAEKDADPLPGPSGVEIVTVSVTRPSPGDTISPARRESSAQDRGKTTEKTPPAAPAQCAHAQLPVAHTSNAATASKLKP
jgi:hypothetical protein